MEEENTERPASVRREPYPDFRALRESQGKTLKDISQKTRIRVTYLESIEQGQFQFLPEPTYAENFIRTYAREMGVNSHDILSRYRKYLKDLAGPEEEQATKERQHEKGYVAILQWFKEHLPVFRISRAHLKILAWTLSVLLVVSAVVFFIMTDDLSGPDPSRVPLVSSADKPSQQPGATEAPSNPTAQIEPQQTAQAPTPPPQEARPEPAPAGTPLMLVITARETTWVRIVEDQKVAYQFLLSPGDRVERQAEKSFDLDVGNAGGIDVEFQGRLIGRLGKSGEVVHLTLPEEGRL